MVHSFKVSAVAPAQIQLMLLQAGSRANKVCLKHSSRLTKNSPSQRVTQRSVFGCLIQDFRRMPVASSASLHVCCVLPLFTTHPVCAEQTSCSLLFLKSAAYSGVADHQERRALTKARPHSLAICCAGSYCKHGQNMPHNNTRTRPTVIGVDVLRNATNRCTQQALKVYRRAEVA